MPNDNKSAFSQAFGPIGKTLGNIASGGLASAADSFLGGVSNALFGGIAAKRDWKYKKKEMALQQQYNLENMQKQYDYQLDFWNKNNEYNDPSNATARWRAAGISPQAVFGSSPGGAGVSGGSVSVPNSENPKASGVDQRGFAGMTLAEAAMMRNQQRITDADVKVKEAEARLKNSQAVDQEWKNTLQPLYEQQLNDLVSITDSQAAQEAIKTAWLPFEKSMQMALGSADLKLKDKALAKFEAQIDELKSQKILNDELANEAKERARNLAEQTITEGVKRENIEADTEYKKSLKDTEDKLRDGRIKLNERQARQVLQDIGLSEAKTLNEYEKLIQAMTGTQPASSMWALVDRLVARIDRPNGKAGYRAAGEMRQRLAAALAKFEKKN